MLYGEIAGLEKKISKIILGNDKLKKYTSALKLWDFYYENGGNAFDNSIYYRGGESEKFLGKWIKSRGLERNIVLISKVGEESSQPSEIFSLLQTSLFFIRNLPIVESQKICISPFWIIFFLRISLTIDWKSKVFITFDIP